MSDQMEWDCWVEPVLDNGKFVRFDMHYAEGDGPWKVRQMKTASAQKLLQVFQEDRMLEALNARDEAMHGVLLEHLGSQIGPRKPDARRSRHGRRGN